MNEKPLDQTNRPEESEQPEIVVNEYGETRDAAVVVEEADRTVLLTPDETIVIDKEPRIDVVPSNRPRKVYGGMWGPAELVTIGFAMVAIFMVAMIYIFMVAPAKRELEHNRAERDRLEAELISARNKYGDITNTETQVEKLMTSVDDFEANHLSVAANGRTSLYQRINSLIAGYGLVNTSGPDYTPLETLDQNSGPETQEESGRAKYKSLFPGVYVTMTVEGPYQNIRRFIREVETGSDFIVVSAVELEPSDNEQKAKQQNNLASQAGPMINPDGSVAQPNPANPNQVNPNFGGGQTAAPPSRNKGKMHGDLVSLRIEMAAYFRRPSVIPNVPAAVQQ
jgi:uncharacterized membrane protein